METSIETSRPKTRSLALTSTRSMATIQRHSTCPPNTMIIDNPMAGTEEELIRSSSNFNKFLSVTAKRHNFQLNKNKALKKKMSACDRPVMCESTENDGLITIRCQTGIYELLKRATFTYYKEPQQHGLTANIELWQDQACNNTQAAIKVSQMHSHRTYYTVCLYHTTSTICINGTGTKKFFERDWPQLEQIIFEMNQVCKNTDPPTLNSSFKACLQEVIDVLGMPKKRKDNKASHGKKKPMSVEIRDYEDNQHGAESVLPAESALPDADEQQLGWGPMPHLGTNDTHQLSDRCPPLGLSLHNNSTPPQTLETWNRYSTTNNADRNWATIGRHEQPSGTPVSGCIKLAKSKEESQASKQITTVDAAKPESYQPYQHTMEGTLLPYSQLVTPPRDNIGRHEQPSGLPAAEAHTDPQAGKELRTSQSHTQPPEKDPKSTDIRETMGRHEQPRGFPPAGEYTAYTRGRPPIWPPAYSSTMEENLTDTTCPNRAAPQQRECPDCHRYKTKMDAMELDYQGLTKKMKIQEKALTQREKELSTKGTQYASARTHITALEAQIKQLQDTNTLLADRVAILEARPDRPVSNDPPRQNTNDCQEDRISKLERQLQEIRITQLELRVDSMTRQTGHPQTPTRERPDAHYSHHPANHTTGTQQHSHQLNAGAHPHTGPLYTHYYHPIPPQRLYQTTIQSPYNHMPMHQRPQHANVFQGQNLYIPTNTCHSQQTYRHQNSEPYSHHGSDPAPQDEANPQPQQPHGRTSATSSPNRKRRISLDNPATNVKRPKEGTHHVDELMQIHTPWGNNVREQMAAENLSHTSGRNDE